MNIPLNKMSVSEKLEAISLIWDSLASNLDDIPVPEWQRAELEQRLKRLDSGDTTKATWGEAEKRFDELGQ